jgi:hypothetical protein
MKADRACNPKRRPQVPSCRFPLVLDKPLLGGFQMLTQKRLKELLHYDPETGLFVWLKNTTTRNQKGTVVGSLNSSGYIQTSIFGKAYYVHRLVWLYVYGYFPEKDIDHVNQKKNDNRLVNLRESSRSCNMRNTGNMATNISGVRGVSWDKKGRKWAARICINYTSTYIYKHKDFGEAVCHRLAAEQCVGWAGCDSSSPAFQYVQKMLGEYN